MKTIEEWVRYHTAEEPFIRNVLRSVRDEALDAAAEAIRRTEEVHEWKLNEGTLDAIRKLKELP